MPGGGVAIQHRHLAVHHHHVHAAFAQGEQCLRAIGGIAHLALEYAQQLLGHHPVDRVVFHQQHAQVQRRQRRRGQCVFSFGQQCGGPRVRDRHRQQRMQGGIIETCGQPLLPRARRNGVVLQP
ncbi:hypothetical protein G6F24_017109 [Rhizopus arrhizus]|nr:hypothetical protein G6F24_017109 [Rhizopus arrhizus]